MSNKINRYTNKLVVNCSKKTWEEDISPSITKVCETTGERIFTLDELAPLVDDFEFSITHASMGMTYKDIIDYYGVDKLEIGDMPVYGSVQAAYDIATFIRTNPNLLDFEPEESLADRAAITYGYGVIDIDNLPKTGDELSKLSLNYFIELYKENLKEMYGTHCKQEYIFNTLKTEIDTECDTVTYTDGGHVHVLEFCTKSPYSTVESCQWLQELCGLTEAMVVRLYAHEPSKPVSLIIPATDGDGVMYSYSQNVPILVDDVIPLSHFNKTFI